MRKHVSSSRGSIYTLGQSGTEKSLPLSFNHGKLVNGRGSEILDTASLTKRADKKMIAQKVILALIDDARKKGMGDWEKSLWNAYRCQQEIITSEGKVFGKYCKYRICPICSNIRKAEKINDYLPIVDSWSDPHFVTLTVKAVSAKRLDPVIDSMVKEFRKIKNAYRKREHRGTGKKLIGIRTLECNFNPKNRTYNPHFHVIVADKEMADTLKREWLRRSKPKWTHPAAQKIRAVKDTERDMIETIKYSAKILTEPDPRKEKKDKGPRKVYISALNNILFALHGHHVFDRFGFNLPIKKVKPESRLTHVTDFDSWAYDPSVSDWVNIETGGCLAGFIPEDEIASILRDGLDMDLQ